MSIRYKEFPKDSTVVNNGMLLNIEQQLYYDVLRIRAVEEKIVEEYKNQEMRCPVHLSIGQEACAVGVCKALFNDDHVFSGHRNHAHYLAKGGSLKAMIGELYGKKSGCARGKGGSMHLTDRKAGFIASTPIVGSTIPIAIGNAYANKLKENKKVTVIFFGDGAVETGVFYESLNIASVMKLPIVFVCENNLYSVYSPLSVRQPIGRKIYKTANALSIDSINIDSENVLTIYENMKTIIEKVRNETCPFFLEINTYRYKEHCGPGVDDNLGYRSVEEIEMWKNKDPVIQIKKNLNSSFQKIIMDKINQEVFEAFEHAKISEFPENIEAELNVFKEN